AEHRQDVARKNSFRPHIERLVKRVSSRQLLTDVDFVQQGLKSFAFTELLEKAAGPQGPHFPGAGREGFYPGWNEAQKLLYPLKWAGLAVGKQQSARDRILLVEFSQKPGDHRRVLALRVI